MMSTPRHLHVLAVLLIAGCGAGAPNTAPPTGRSTVAATAVATVPSETAPPPAPTTTPEPIDCADLDALEHQAPELEAHLPTVVAGRNLSIWSVRGTCLLRLVMDVGPDQIEEFLAEIETPGDPARIDVDNLAYGIAGRQNTASDPPYFVFAAARPADEDEIFLNLFLLLAGASVVDIPAAARLDGFAAKSIAGKAVYVGTEDMLGQSVHQRGRPYLYQTEDTMFLVVTDDAAWAKEAIEKLP